MSGKEGRNGSEMKEGKSKRSAETEETDDAKRKKVEQPAGKLLVSNCTPLRQTSFTCRLPRKASPKFSPMASAYSWARLARRWALGSGGLRTIHLTAARREVVRSKLDINI